MSGRLLANASCVAIGGRGILIEGPPGSGKSSLALSLIDRGAVLVGDDGVMMDRRGATLWASPPATIKGLLEIRGVGIATVPTCAAPLCLILSLGSPAERLPTTGWREVEGVALPRLPLDSDAAHGALRAEWALALHGLPLPASD